MTVRRLLSLLLILTGLVVGAWTVSVWQWQDPVTAIYTAYRQAQLSSELKRRAVIFNAEAHAAHPVSAALHKPAPPRVPFATQLRPLAAQYDAASPPGSPLGKLHIPRLGLNVTVVNGTDMASLHTGPGRDERSALPGQHRLVYIAGHRTTFGAPFANIDELRPGDPIVIELPYATFAYRVTRTRIVDAHDLSVLQPGTHEVLILQACHPRFFATQRILVYANLTHIGPPPQRF